MAGVINPFSAPNRLSNVVLVVQGNKLHVSKEFLAIHSLFFETLFFGNFKENGKEEVEIKEVVYKEFVDLLNVIYPGFFKITAASVSHILKLADQFQIKEAHDQADLFLSKTKKMEMKTKLELANKYNLKRSMASGISHFACVYQLYTLQSSAAYATYTDSMKAAISDKMMQLIGASYLTHTTNKCSNCRCTKQH